MRLLLVLLCCTCACFAQNVSRGTIKVRKPAKDTSLAAAALSLTTEAADMVSVIVSNSSPGFADAKISVPQFIRENMRQPERGRKPYKAGYAEVSFCVKTDGTVSNVQLFRSVPGCPQCDAEALRLVRSMPRWKVQTDVYNGKPVAVYYRIPIQFEAGQ